MSTTRTLWQIGAPGGGVDQFALARDEGDRYYHDGLFVVGLSDPITDWPFAHLGPEDPWAGNKPHTFTIVFDLETVPTSGGDG